jgi:hypothetical protein
MKARLTAWQNHLTETERVLTTVVTNLGNKEYSNRQIVADFLGLGLSCHEAAWGWMYPDDKQG